MVLKMSCFTFACLWTCVGNNGSDLLGGYSRRSDARAVMKRHFGPKPKTLSFSFLFLASAFGNPYLWPSILGHLEMRSQSQHHRLMFLLGSCKIVEPLS